MAVSEGFLEYVLDQLRAAGTVTSRRMFGGVGLYLDDVFFAILADDVLYFKVDESNRRDYVAARMRPFKPYPDRPVSMRYYAVPVRVLESPQELAKWATKALAAARSQQQGALTRAKRRKSGAVSPRSRLRGRRKRTT